RLLSKSTDTTTTTTYTPSLHDALPICREPQDAQRDDGNYAGIDQHAEHQPLVHDGEDLPPLADESEPLGPGRDESGRRCVHRPRSEEHTSELQSRFDLVCRLLLEKKKT